MYEEGVAVLWASARRCSRSACSCAFCASSACRRARFAACNLLITFGVVCFRLRAAGLLAAAGGAFAALDAFDAFGLVAAREEGGDGEETGVWSWARLRGAGSGEVNGAGDTW